MFEALLQLSSMLKIAVVFGGGITCPLGSQGSKKTENRE